MKALTITALTIGLSITSAATATVIFQDNFDGTIANLQSASPDIGTGTWVTSNNFDRNGDVNITAANAGSATLAFTPVDGLIYTAEASFTLSAGGAGDWVAFGFANGQSANAGTGYRFLSGNNVEGRAWMYARENTNNPGAQLTGNGDGTSWAGYTQSPRDLDLRIILDTTGGAGTWAATWFAKDAGDASYTEVRSAALLNDEDINSIGFAVSGNGVTASISNFSLTSEVPEPASLALLGLGGMLLASRRRR
jgi:hypothetical protein